MVEKGRDSGVDRVEDAEQIAGRIQGGRQWPDPGDHVHDQVLRRKGIAEYLVRAQVDS